MLKATVVGNYPKISSDKNEVNLRNAKNSFEKEKITVEELEDIFQKTVKRVIKEQEEIGVDVITDGQIRWDDLVTPFARNIEGFEIGGLIRFFDNNVYYRKPIVKSKLKFKNFSSVEDFKFAKQNSTKEIKAVIPGAFTFACMSVDEHYNNLDKLTLDLADILAQEAKGLEKAGAQVIQIDEPWVCFHPEKIDLVKKSIEIIAGNLKIKTAIYLYFGSIKDIAKKLFDFSVDIIGIDVVSKPENLDFILQNNFDKELGLGCIEARNTKLEDEAELLKLFEKVSNKINKDKIWINPSCGLEFLPHSDTVKKLQKMVSAVRKFNQGG